MFVDKDIVQWVEALLAPHVHDVWEWNLTHGYALQTYDSFSVQYLKIHLSRKYRG